MTRSVPLPSAGCGWQWESLDGVITLPVLPSSLRELTQRYDLCITGEGLAHLQAVNRQQLLKLIPHIQVFARVVPKQKVRDSGCFWRVPGAAEVLACGGGKAQSPELALGTCRVVPLKHPEPPQNSGGGRPASPGGVTQGGWQQTGMRQLPVLTHHLLLGAGVRHHSAEEPGLRHTDVR